MVEYKDGVCKECKSKFKYDPGVQTGKFCSKKCRYEQNKRLAFPSLDVVEKGLEDWEPRGKVALEKWDEIKGDPIELAHMASLIGVYERKKGIRDKVVSSLAGVEISSIYRRIVQERGLYCQRCGKDLIDDAWLMHHKDGRTWNNIDENLLIICKFCNDKLHTELGRYSQRFAGLHTVEKAIAEILTSLKVDLKMPDFVDTPVRVARMYNEFFEGMSPDAEVELSSIFASSFPNKNDNMVIVKDTRVYSLCPHHLLPVAYDITIGYIPKGFVLGLSKFARISEILAKKPVLQEELTVEIAELIQKELKPDGVIVNISGQHYCMMMRGVKQQNSIVHTSHVLGAFKHGDVKQEFLALSQLALRK